MSARRCTVSRCPAGAAVPVRFDRDGRPGPVWWYCERHARPHRYAAESGTGTVEYLLLVMLVAFMALLAVTWFGAAVAELGSRGGAL